MPAPSLARDGVIAKVDSSTLTGEELSLFGGTDSGAAGAWVDDELLAQLARSEGLDNPFASGFVGRRAVQLYLRDRLVERELASVRMPDRAELLSMMRSDSLLYEVERHYYEILVADSATAESLRARLAAGQSFQVMAQNVSMGQKAALGGDLGFLVGGELTGRGLPHDIGTITGLSRVVRSDLGWHIFLVTEVRALTDTARVTASLSEVVVGRRERALVDSLLDTARARFEVSEP